MKTPNYGIDAPGLARLFLVTGVIASVVAFVVFFKFHANSPWKIGATATLSMIACYFLGMGCLMVTWSKVIKVRGRETMLDLVSWSGGERVLDVGCGRGLMAIGAAKRLTTGIATGVDIWIAEDQSGNSREGALSNAQIEGVADRVDIQTADMRSLPFDNASFDVVVSHWAVHNLESESDRNIALSEIYRVLRPGSTLILADIEHRKAYLSQLEMLGMRDVRIIVDDISDAFLNIVSFGSFRPATIVASKPPTAAS